MKFSVCTPVTFNRDDPDEIRMPRYKMFQRCWGSVESQSFKDFEWVIADDMSEPAVEFPDEFVRIVRLKEKSGRIIARNAAMKEAKGDWITWLDADDEYASFYLEALDDAIRLNPEVKVFNFNHLIFDYNYNTHVRKFINMDIQKDLPFPSGTIGAGAYVFHRSVYEDIGPIPEMGLWQFSENAFKEFPEIKPYFLKPGSTEYNSLGNPWGEDYYYFYKITRKYQSMYLDFAPYFVHSHWGHRWSFDPDYVVDPGKKKEWNPKNL